MEFVEFSLTLFTEPDSGVHNMEKNVLKGLVIGVAFV